MSPKRVRAPRVRVQRNTRTEVIDEDRRPRSAREREAIAAELDEVLADIDEALQVLDDNT